MQIQSAIGAPALRHFAVHYNDLAAIGLPVGVSAHEVQTSRVGEQRWLQFIRQPPSSATSTPPLIVWQVPTESVAAFAERNSPAEAWAAGVSGEALN